MGSKMSAAQREGADKKKNLKQVNKKKGPAQDRVDEDDGNFGEFQPLEREGGGKTPHWVEGGVVVIHPIAFVVVLVNKHGG